MQEPDIRWQQRFHSFKKALAQLAAFVDPQQLALMGYSAELTPREELGMIKAFELCYEQGWKTLKDLLEYGGFTGPTNPNAILQQALEEGYITDSDGWRDLHKSRTRTIHVYEQETADEVADKIRLRYYDLFTGLRGRLTKEIRV